MADNQIQNFLLNSDYTTVLKKTLDAQAARQRAHAQNIANAETPGYQRVKVEFEDLLKDVVDQAGIGDIKRSDPNHLPNKGAAELEALEPKIRKEMPDPNGTGVNGVNIDEEMAEMAETQLRYLTAMELLKRRYANLKSAIKGTP